MSTRLPMRLRGLMCAVIGVSLAACAGSVGPAPAPGVVVMFDTVEVRAASDADLERRVATLELQLLEGTAQEADLRRELQAARQEVVRSMARSQTLATRAEAASAMAEAEIGVRAVSGTTGGAEAAEAAQGRDLLELSAAEFAKENYGGAHYLASQARRIARAGEYRLTSAGHVDRQPTETLFALPVPLETERRSNLRDGPGLGFQVLVILEAGLPVVGHSYTDQWVRITDEEGRDGWIFHDLVSNRDEDSP